MRIAGFDTTPMEVEMPEDSPLIYHDLTVKLKLLSHSTGRPMGDLVDIVWNEHFGCRDSTATPRDIGFDERLLLLLEDFPP